MRLGVSLAATIQQVFSVRGFDALFPCAGTLGCTDFLTPHLLLPIYLYTSVGQPSLPVAPSPGLQVTTLPALVLQPLPCYEFSPPRCLSPPLLPVQINVSSLTPRLSDFNTVQFSGSSGCFLFLNLLFSSF